MKHYDLTAEEAGLATALMDDYLYRGYSEEIRNRAAASGHSVTQQVVRLVKLGRTKNPIVFHLLLIYAAENKTATEDVQDKIKEQLSK